MKEEILKLYKPHWFFNQQLQEKEVDSLIKDIKKLKDENLAKLLNKYLEESEPDEIVIFGIKYEIKLRRKQKIEKLLK